MSRGFNLPAITALPTTFGEQGAVNRCHRVGFVHITPQHNRTTLAVVGRAGVDQRAALHRHRGGLVQGIGVGKHAALFVGATLPVAPHQHRAAASGAGGQQGAAVGEQDVFGLHRDRAAFALCRRHVHGAGDARLRLGRLW